MGQKQGTPDAYQRLRGMRLHAGDLRCRRLALGAERLPGDARLGIPAHWTRHSGALDAAFRRPPPDFCICICCD